MLRVPLFFFFFFFFFGNLTYDLSPARNFLNEEAHLNLSLSSSIFLCIDIAPVSPLEIMGITRQRELLNERATLLL